MLIWACLLLLSYASMAVNPAKGWFMTVFGLLFVPIALVNVIYLFWAIKRMSSAFLIPLLALLPSLIFIGRYVQFSSGAEDPTPDTVQLVSYNVGRYILGKGQAFKGDEGEKACMDSVANFIRKSDAQIICLQEVSLAGEYDVANALKNQFPEFDISYFMFVDERGSYGNVTLSRFPIVDKGKIEFEHSSNLAIYSDIKIGKSTVRVYNCHFQSYSISFTSAIKSIGKDSTLVRVEEKMKKSIRIRPQQVDKVMSDIEDCPRQAIVTGDFNDNPMSYTYSRLTRGKQDVFVEAGKGFGATYSVLWPFIRIDYVLIPDSYEAVSYKVPRLKYSDHYPVVTRFNVKDE